MPRLLIKLEKSELSFLVLSEVVTCYYSKSALLSA